MRVRTLCMDIHKVHSSKVLKFYTPCIMTQKRFFERSICSWLLVLSSSTIKNVHKYRKKINKQKSPFLNGHSINFLCIFLFFHVEPFVVNSGWYLCLSLSLSVSLSVSVSLSLSVSLSVSLCLCVSLCLSLCLSLSLSPSLSFFLWACWYKVLLSFVFRCPLFSLFILLFIYSFTDHRFFAVLIGKYIFLLLS